MGASSTLLAAIILLAVVANSLFAITSLVSKSLRTTYVNYYEIMRDLRLNSVHVGFKYVNSSVYAYSEIPVRVLGIYLEEGDEVTELKSPKYIGSSLTKLTYLGQNSTNNSSLIVILDGGRVKNLSINSLREGSSNSGSQVSREATDSLGSARLLSFATGTVYLPISYLTLQYGPTAYGTGKIIHPKWFFTLSYGVSQINVIDVSPNEVANTYFDVDGGLINTSALNITGRISSSDSTTALLGQLISYHGLHNITVSISVKGSVNRGIGFGKYVALVTYYVIPSSTRIDLPVNLVPYLTSSGIIPLVPVERNVIKPIPLGTNSGNIVRFSYSGIVDIDLSSAPSSGYIILGCEVAFRQYINYYYQEVKIVSYS